MNITARLSSLTLAAVFTLAMLLGVNELATVPAGPAQLAQSAADGHS